MTPSDLTLLFLGFSLGVLAMTLTGVIDSYAALRHSRIDAERVLARHRKWTATDGWREVLIARERA
ncbi:hypothetical protein ABZ498_06475 [Streptomyces lavendulocolor]|uniref:hypothetical protein n=1 Tax=Streptomyces lavendulocolor TaxID=67316 RepID=UPI0033E3DFF0